MRTVWPLTVAVLVALGLAAPVGAQSEPAAEKVKPTPAQAAEANGAAASDKSPTAILIGANEGTWSLVSDGKDSRVVAKLGWQTPSGEFAFGIESSASVQKGSPDTSLLNLDGLAGGDTSVSGQVSYRQPYLRRGGDLLSVCEQINLAIEKQIRTDRGDAPEAFHGGACTLDKLRDVGGTWAADADKAERDALAWACGELTKLNPDIVLILKNVDLKRKGVPVERFGKTDVCTPSGFVAAVATERKRREGSGDFVEAQTNIQVAKVERGKFLEQIAATEAEFAGATDAGERQRLAARRLELDELVAKQDRIIAENESKLKALLPELLTTKELEVNGQKETISVALAKKNAELLAALCKRFNEPDRSAELVLEGFNQSCEFGSIEKAIASLGDPRVRNRLRRDVIVEMPAGVWALTLRGGLDNKGFKFVDPDALSGFTHFAELEAGVQSETEHDSLFGVAGTLQDGANFWRLGYDRKNVHQGGDAADTCLPSAAGSSVLRCLAVVLGAPKRVEENVATVEYRRLLSTRLGLSVRGLFLDEAVRNKKEVSDEWEGHLVLYFLTHATQGLNGGIDVAYDSLSKKPAARLFIGQSFNLFE